MSQAKGSLSSYDPRWLEIWRDGAIREVKIPVGKRAKATTLRHRLYKLREAMRKAQHPYSEAAEKAKIRLVKDEARSDEFWNLLVLPADLEFSSVLDAAGYKEEELPPLED